MNAEPNRFFKNASPKKVVNPPGGMCSDIFNTSPCESQANTRKIRDNLKSSIFDTTDNGHPYYTPSNPRPNQIGTEAVDDEKSASPKRYENTQNRLFGENDSQLSARKPRLSDTVRSSVFQTDSELTNVVTPRKKISNGTAINPITGTPLKGDIGNTNGHDANGVDPNGNLVANGNGYHNGSTNGHHHSNDSTPVSNGQTKVFRRPPPGGYSSGIF